MISVQQAPKFLKAAVVAGFVASYGALFWLFSFGPSHTVIADRLGYVSTVYTTLAVLCLCWAAMFAFVVVKRNWSVRACRWAGLALVIPCAVFLFEPSPAGSSPLALILFQMTLTSYLCRKFAFPEMSDEDATRPEPLPTMFPK